MLASPSRVFTSDILIFMKGIIDLCDWFHEQQPARGICRPYLLLLGLVLAVLAAAPAAQAWKSEIRAATYPEGSLCRRISETTLGAEPVFFSQRKCQAQRTCGHAVHTLHCTCPRRTCSAFPCPCPCPIPSYHHPHAMTGSSSYDSLPR
jgi:hypothetical protein